jgi:hypothetical protein
MFVGKSYFLRLTCALVIFICGFGGCTQSKQGDIVESWETTNGYFKVRVVAYKERPHSIGLPGTFYVFSSSLVNEDSWQAAMVFRHDDRPLIPRNNIRFANDQIGCIFMESMYAVTTDAGKTWFTWDATKNVADWSWYKYGYIRDVQLSSDGTGLMVMRPRDDPARKDFAEHLFLTNDFGRHWDKNQ